MTSDRFLSKRFTLYHLTRTDHADLQEQNRHVTDDELAKLADLAALLELVADAGGCELDIHSGRRFLILNKRVGGSERSQHLKCEAADCSPRGPDTEESVEALFQKVLAAAKEGKLKFGQLIIESDGRGRESRKVWLHVSLGAPYRDPARCGEALRMRDGKFELVAKVA